MLRPHRPFGAGRRGGRWGCRGGGSSRPCGHLQRPTFKMPQYPTERKQTHDDAAGLRGAAASFGSALLFPLALSTSAFRSRPAREERTGVGWAWKRGRSRRAEETRRALRSPTILIAAASFGNPFNISKCPSQHPQEIYKHSSATLALELTLEIFE